MSAREWVGGDRGEHSIRKLFYKRNDMVAFWHDRVLERFLRIRVSFLLPLF